MKKKGFTLIELLAVIIILAIVALVATPIVLNVINDAKKNAGLSEAKMIYSGINNYCEEAKYRKQLNGTENICEDGVSIEEVKQMVNLGNAKIIKLTYANKVTELTVESNGHTYTLKNGEIALGEDGDSGKEEMIGRQCIDSDHIELQSGDVYTDDQYEYVYKKEYVNAYEGSGSYYTDWTDIEADGWGVRFNDLSATKIEMPPCSTINGKPIVSMQFMFAGSDSAGVNLTTVDLNDFDTSNVTNMAGMFQGVHAPIIFGNSFDTSKVTNMRWMFYRYFAASLDLSRFNTSNVTDMDQMFHSTSVSTLDLSSFDTSNVINMDSMFWFSEATTGYARTQADADKLNASKPKPDTLTFVVKPTN